MIRDIEHSVVENVTIAISLEKNNLMLDEWKVYVINNNNFPLENVLVASTGYGEKDGEKQRTSTLRHFLQTIPPNSVSLVEPIDTAILHLNNEYWLSYYIGTRIFDKRFVFVPDSVHLENLTYIKELDRQGILHS